MSKLSQFMRDPFVAASAGIVALTLGGSALAFKLSTPSEFGNFIPEAGYALKARHEKFDNRPTAVFTSTADCKIKGHDAGKCDLAERAAREIARQYSTSPNFETKASCLEKFGSCAEVTYNIQRVAAVAKGGPINHPETQVKFKPNLVGWQSARSDISYVTPLYSGKAADTAIRADGREFKLQ